MTSIHDYIEAHLPPQPAELEALERRTQLSLYNPRMCSGRLQGRLLSMLSAMVNPRAALELGTYSAYASLCIAGGLAPEGRLHTIEANDELEDFIRASLAASPLGERVTPHFGHALEILPRLLAGRQIDFAFIDADKREYPEYYRLIRPAMRTGGLIVADNTLWSGHVVDPGALDAQTLGIKRFNDMVAADCSVESVILPLRDGLSLIRCS